MGDNDDHVDNIDHVDTDDHLILMQVMITEDAKYDDGVVQEAVVEKFVKYFKAIFHHNSWYFGYFVTCEQKMENFNC